MTVLVPSLIMGGLGVLFGIGLAYAARKLCVVNDPRLEKVFAKLPGVNCGACGNPGCMAFAEALIKGTCTVERCTVSSATAKVEIAGLLGVEVKQKVKTVAVLHCNGGAKVKDRFEYAGFRDCTAAALVHGGPKECVYGCIGFGTCARVCKFGAITMGPQGLPEVHEEKCVSCGACVNVCPKKLFSLIAVTKAYAIRCASLDLGKKVMDVCAVGCIGCGACKRACPTGVIVIQDNLSVIDYHKCDNRGECFRVCPRNSIAKKENRVWQAR